MSRSELESVVPFASTGGWSVGEPRSARFKTLKGVWPRSYCHYRVQLSTPTAVEAELLALLRSLRPSPALADPRATFALYFSWAVDTSCVAHFPVSVLEEMSRLGMALWFEARSPPPHRLPTSQVPVFSTSTQNKSAGGFDSSEESLATFLASLTPGAPDVLRLTWVEGQPRGFSFGPAIVRHLAALRFDLRAVCVRP